MKWGRRGDSHSRGANRPAVYETAAVAAEPRRHEMVGRRGFCPVFCRFKRPRLHCQSLQPNRDTKAELNRRSQACEGPGRHRYSRRVKWSERRVMLPLALAPEAGASLLGYALNKLPSALNPASGHYFDRARSLPAHQVQLGKRKWSSIRVLRPVFRFGRPACISQHLCSEKMESRVESHSPARFCRPLPGLLGQRDFQMENGECKMQNAGAARREQLR